MTAINALNSAYVWCMVVESEVVIYDRMVGMVRFEKMLQRSRSLFCRSFDIVDFDWR